MRPGLQGSTKKSTTDRPQRQASSFSAGPQHPCDTLAATATHSGFRAEHPLQFASAASAPSIHAHQAGHYDARASKAQQPLPASLILLRPLALLLEIADRQQHATCNWLCFCPPGVNETPSQRPPCLEPETKCKVKMRQPLWWVNSCEHAGSQGMYTPL